MDKTYIALILGIICGSVLYYTCGYKKFYRGPNSADVKQQIHYHNNKCYILEPKIHICPKFLQ